MSDDLPKMGISGLGDTYHMTGEVDRVPPYDPRSGDHFWCIPVMYRVTDPARWYDDSQPDESRILDMENIAVVTGVGCFYCERLYRRGMEHRRCPGPPR